MNWYLDIETNGLDPRESKILTIQYVPLERGTGKQLAEVTILKSWEMSVKNMLKKFIYDVRSDSNYPFDFIPVGYNLDFENKFLNHYSKAFYLPEINLGVRPKIDLFGIGIIMNGGEFKGASLDNFTTKEVRGTDIPKWYESKDYFLIEDYIKKETKAFIDWYQQLLIELPLLRNKLS